MTVFSVLGRKIPRQDSPDKVRGSAIYAGDIQLPRMLYGKLLRSSYAHAKILSVKTEKAEKIPGVRAIVTAKDALPVAYGLVTPPIVPDCILFTDGKTRYRGDVIAAVAAETLEAAEKAIDSIEVDYEPLEVLTAVEEAMKPGAPLIHEKVKPIGEPKEPVRNLCTYTRIHRGDVEKAFKQSDIVVEEEYETQVHHQAYLEPHAAVAQVDKGGKITVWTSTQGPYLLRAQLGKVLNLPMTKVRVIGCPTGGGFGAKLEIWVEGYCALLSMKTGQPVKITLTRYEEFTAGAPRPRNKIWIKSGVMKDGRIVARVGKVIVDVGAYSKDGPIYSSIAPIQLMGPYNIPNVEAEGLSVYTNKPPAGAFRGPGTTEPTFAVESHMDTLASRVNIDPLEFRLMNVWENGSLGPTGQRIESPGLKEALTRAAERVGWKSLKLKGYQGKGIACGLIPSVGLWASGAHVKINEDGTVHLFTGASDPGTGAGSTALPAIVAEELGVPIEDVTVISSDTDNTPFDGGAQGSRTVYGAGSAVLSASRDAKNQLLEAAAGHLEARVEDLEIGEKRIWVKGSKSTAVSIATIASVRHSQGGQILGKGTYVEGAPPFDRECIEGFYLIGSMSDPIFVAHSVVVEVDEGTGKVNVIRYVASQDSGTVLNPSGLEGQIEGGSVQGLGYALFEQVLVDDSGFVLNPSFGDYKIPTALDVPRVESIFIEGYAGSGPYGAKGAGEAPIVPGAAAVANAFFDATGCRLYKIPITPEAAYRAMKTLKR